MHLAQARTLLPAFFPCNKRTHCRLGYFLTLDVGLYLPLSFMRVTPIDDFFPQIEQTFSTNLKFEIRNLNSILNLKY